MIRRILVVILFVFFVSTSSLIAGTWRTDFEDGNLGGWGGLDNSWAVENGEFSGAFFDPNSGNIIWMGDDGWKDYTVGCKMKFVDWEAPDGRAGIMFRHRGMDSSNLYAFAIRADAKTAWCTALVQGVRTIQLDIPLPFNPSKDVWYELKIIVKGNLFEFYIDGEIACKFEDKSISSGKIGLFIRQAHAHFDDLIISGDDVKDGGNWDPAKHPEEKKAVEPKGKLATMWGEIKYKR